MCKQTVNMSHVTLYRLVQKFENYRNNLKFTHTACTVSRTFFCKFVETFILSFAKFELYVIKLFFFATFWFKFVSMAYL